MEVNKIVKLKIKNFMSIVDAEIEFDDSNIITLCGYNDSGKSAITRLMEIMFYNAYPSDQAKFITDDEEFWVGELIFSDGVSIKRIKYADGKSEFEMKKDGKVIFTNRLDNGTFAAMGDIPDKIKEYLGVIQDEFTEEKLNVRRNTDKLFLINTTGGDNYKILNSVLQSDMLAETSKRINQDKNKLNQEVSTLETKKDLIGSQISEQQIIPDEVEKTTKDLVTKVVENAGKLSRVNSIVDLKGSIDSIQIYDEVESIDIEAFNLLTLISNSYNQSNISTQPEVKEIDTEKINLLKGIIELEKSTNIAIYDEIEQVETNKLKDIFDLGVKYKTYYESNNLLTKIEEELTKVKQELEQMSKQYNLKICGNCGSMV